PRPFTALLPGRPDHRRDYGAAKRPSGAAHSHGVGPKSGTTRGRKRGTSARGGTSEAEIGLPQQYEPWAANAAHSHPPISGDPARGARARTARTRAAHRAGPTAPTGNDLLHP